MTTYMVPLVLVGGLASAGVYLLLERFADAAVGLGFDRQDAERAVTQTFSGALALLDHGQEAVPLGRRQILLGTFQPVELHPHGFEHWRSDQCGGLGQMACLRLRQGRGGCADLPRRHTAYPPDHGYAAVPGSTAAGRSIPSSSRM